MNNIRSVIFLCYSGYGLYPWTILRDWSHYWLICLCKRYYIFICHGCLVVFPHIQIIRKLIFHNTGLVLCKALVWATSCEMYDSITKVWIIPSCLLTGVFVDRMPSVLPLLKWTLKECIEQFNGKLSLCDIILFQTITPLYLTEFFTISNLEEGILYKSFCLVP